MSASSPRSRPPPSCSTRTFSASSTPAPPSHPDPERSEGEGSGSIGTEFLFDVMPFIDGESLRDRLDRERQLPVADAVRITREVADALDYAHRHGVIHRDIEPENILTETGMSLGTPSYMSPEQALGDRDIGPRSDVYALGAMTCEMLTGEPPFTGPNSQAIVAKVLMEQPPLLRAKRPTVSPTIEGAVLTALQKLPADRFTSAKDFADTLEGSGKGATYAQTRMTGATRPPRPVVLVLRYALALPAT